MKSLHYMIAAACVSAAAVSVGQENVTRTERTETRTEANGTSRQTRTVTTTVSTYVDQVRTVYTSAGLPANLVDRMIELDRRIYTAYTAGDWSTVRRLRIEQRQILNPEQITKVYTYLQSNPLPADIAPVATYTFVPQQQFQTHIVQNESGQIQPGTLTVPGVSAAATVERNASDTQAPAVEGRTAETRPGETRTELEPGKATMPDDARQTDADRPTVEPKEVRPDTEATEPGNTVIKADPETPNESATTPDAPKTDNAAPQADAESAPKTPGASADKN